MQRLSKAWKPLAGATVLVGGPTLAYYSYTGLLPFSSKPQTFDLAIRVRGPDGKPQMTTRSYSLLSKPEVEQKLHENVRSESRTLESTGQTWRWSTAQVAANAPIEDAHASAVLSRSETVKGPNGDLLFFSVMDGHGGFHTSRLLSKTLIPAVILELQALASEPSTMPKKTGVLQSILSSLWPGSSSPAAQEGKEKRFDSDPAYVSLALRTAFANLDSELINAPLRLLASHSPSTKSLAPPDLSQHPMGLASMLPAMSGACAILAFVDTANEKLYVANTGDSRAVAGFWDERADGTGQWRMEVLSEDQTGRNPKEFLRVQSEHPEDEAPFVIQRGRILGGLEPSRAFGDARYKWSRETQQLLGKVFLGDKPMRPAPSLLKTPPYVTAQPVVTHLSLSSLPSPTSTSPPSSTSASTSPVIRSTPRFLILATDGLWDKLPSSTLTSLCAAHLSGLRGTLSSSALNSRFPITAGSSSGIDGKSHLSRDSGDNSGESRWTFEEEDLSSHLIRNAFGGAKEKELRELMSIPEGLARSYRDDVTVTVVVFPTEGEKTPLKAKL